MSRFRGHCEKEVISQDIDQRMARVRSMRVHTAASASLYNRNNDLRLYVKNFYYDDIWANDVRYIPTETGRNREEVGKEKKKTLREDKLRKSCIIERLRSFVMVPYGFAIIGIEGSDEKKREEKARNRLRFIINASSPSVFFPKYLHETSCRAETRRNEESRLHRRQSTN